jgi:protein-L-isoaspartate(D-aspartate) O-methyltransferase
MKATWVLLVMSIGYGGVVCMANADQAIEPTGTFAAERQALVHEIRYNVRQTSEYIGRQTLDERVMRVMGEVPRHEFVPESVRDSAYENRPLAIGHGQTISQPYIVALMTELIEPEPGDRVLEIGTGSGYQAAVLAELVDTVYSIEIVPPLGTAATERLRRLGYENVETRIGDGYYGWPEAAPFDAIVTTAAAGHIPPPLVQQLKPGGVMVIPVGGRFQVQQLTLISKDDKGKVYTRQVLPVRFVPLTGGHDAAPHSQ